MVLEMDKTLNSNDFDHLRKDCKSIIYFIKNWMNVGKFLCLINIEILHLKTEDEETKMAGLIVLPDSKFYMII